MVVVVIGFFFQAEDGIRDLVRSRGLGDVYKRQERRGGHDAQRDEHAEGDVLNRVHAEALHRRAFDLSLIHI